MRTNEAFAALTYRPLLTGNVLQWPDEINRQRKLGGADVLAVRVTREQQQSVTADIQCRPKPVPKGGYVALDLRTWDHTWRPVIVTAYLTDTGPPRVEQLTGAGLQGAPITVQQQGRGRWRIGPLTLPDETHDRPLLVGCWGSVADTQTDPAFGL